MKSTISISTAHALVEIAQLRAKGKRVHLSQICAKHRVARSTIWRALKRGELARVVPFTLYGKARYIYDGRLPLNTGDKT